MRFLLLSSLLASVATAAPVLQERAQTCYSGVYMIVARGSDEAPGEGAPGAVASLVQQQLPNSGSVAVNYPASIFDPPYPDSVSDGIKDTISKITAYVAACGARSKIALIGYSQGGNVMSDVLAGGVAKPTPLSASLAKYVTAVTLFGDPSFTAKQSFDRGTSTSSGIFARGGSSLQTLNTYASKIQDYCNSGDTFCASGTDTSVHGKEVQDYESAAAAFIVAKNS